MKTITRASQPTPPRLRRAARPRCPRALSRSSAGNSASESEGRDGIHAWKRCRGSAALRGARQRSAASRAGRPRVKNAIKYQAFNSGALPPGLPSPPLPASFYFPFPPRFVSPRNFQGGRWGEKKGSKKCGASLNPPVPSASPGSGITCLFPVAENK